MAGYDGDTAETLLKAVRDAQDRLAGPDADLSDEARVAERDAFNVWADYAGEHDLCLRCGRLDVVAKAYCDGCEPELYDTVSEVR